MINYRSRGYSLIELIVSMGLLSVLFSFIFTYLSNHKNIGNEGERILFEESDLNYLLTSFNDSKKCLFQVNGALISNSKKYLSHSEFRLDSLFISDNKKINLNSNNPKDYFSINDKRIRSVKIQNVKKINEDQNGKKHLIGYVNYYGDSSDSLPVFAHMIHLRTSTDGDGKDYISDCGSSSGYISENTDVIKETCQMIGSSYTSYDSNINIYKNNEDDPRFYDQGESLHSVQGYCRKPYEMSFDDLINQSGSPRDALNANIFKVSHSTFMVSSDAANPTLDNSLFFGRFLKDTIVQDIDIIETKPTGIRECKMFRYIYSRKEESHCTTGKFLRLKNTPICVSLDYALHGKPNSENKCTLSCLIDDTCPKMRTKESVSQKLCDDYMNGCVGLPPGANGFINVLLMDRKDLYSTQVGLSSVPFSVDTITTSICDLEDNKNGQCSFSSINGIEPDQYLERGFYSVYDTNVVSDENLKNNIQDIEDSLILKLRPRSYVWKNYNHKKTGFIADEVEKVFPHLVVERFGSKSVNLIALLPHLVYKLQDQQKRILQIKEQIEKD